MTTNNAQYLGDEVYVQEDSDDPSQIILTTGSHELGDSDNIIFLENCVIQSLYKWLQSHNYI
jgi:hypothetical protein